MTSMFTDVMLEGAEIKYIYDQLVDGKSEESVTGRKVFKRLIDAFFAGAIVGYLKGEYVTKVDKDENNRRRIPQSAFINNINTYGVIINTIALLHFYKTGEDEILTKIFDDSDDSWNTKQKIVEAYARGGIKILYDEIIGEKSTNIDDTVEKICELLSNFEENFKLIDNMEEEPLDEVIKAILN